MSHISCVQTLVKGSGKKSSNVFFLPKLLLSFTSTRPEACLDLRVKSGALVPTDNGIRVFTILDFRCSISKLYRPRPIGCQITIRIIPAAACAACSAVWAAAKAVSHGVAEAGSQRREPRGKNC